MRIQSMKSRCGRHVGGLLVILLLIAARPAQASDETSSPVLQPTALAGRDTTVLVGEPLEFFGYGSSPDDEIVLYTWDFDSDGIADFSSAQTGQAWRQFDEAGYYECIFTIEDSVGRTATDSRLVRVVAEQTELTSEPRTQQGRQAVTSASADGTRRWYAVILNGGYDERYWRDVELAYDMLTNGYGLSAGDVYVLNSNGQNPSGQNPNGMIDYQAKVEYIEKVFDELTARADADDELIVLITGHGYGYSGPLSQGGQYLGYNSGRISVDPGDEPDFP
ncbi:MAG: PKD domain-containing protein, partial [Sedimentisphaerales bacterium]|nr:PKD domain-containing protein [Sedimentisphaerales bacterium]